MPSRFGKTYLADMVATYYTNDDECRKLFHDLEISKDTPFENHLNKHNLIKLDIAGICAYVPEGEMVPSIRKAIVRRLAELFPTASGLPERPSEAIAEIRKAFGASFVVVIDEWDYILRNHTDARHHIFPPPTQGEHRHISPL